MRTGTEAVEWESLRIQRISLSTGILLMIFYDYGAFTGHISQGGGKHNAA